MNEPSANRPCNQDDRPWLRGRVPDGYWDLRQNRVAYIDWLGLHLGFAGREDWYRVRNTDFNRNRGGTLLRRAYGSSVYAAMRDYLPDCEWIPWLFPKTPKGFWENAENRRAYMKWLEGALGIEPQEDWYRVTKESFAGHGGAGLLGNYYRGSILSAICEYRPDYDWKPWLFSKVPHGFWKERENRRKYLEWLAGRLGFETSNDWHRLTKRDLAATGGGGLFCGFYGGSLSRLLDEAASMWVDE